ncbi:hypothetical protein OIO90_000383 [Microbotryomycetes sp. JL221]|nr:hypothetical protein OIO90_000383 [Microbotryomycetes sp. JL221]
MFYLLSRLVSTVAGAIYPAYASYKAIKTNDVAKLEVWLMFWVVMGIVMSFESTLEWIVAWFPFYYEVKTLVILWLTLPQIQATHEDEIDRAIADAKVRAKQAGLDWLSRGISKGRELLGGAATFSAVEGADAANSAQRPTPHVGGNTHTGASSSPAAGLVNLAGNYLRQYGPAAAAFAAGHKLLHPMNGRAASVREQHRPTSAQSRPQQQQQQEQMRSLGLGQSPSEPHLPSAIRASGSSLLSRNEVRRRRAELEAELAALSYDVSTTLSSPPPSSSSSSSSSSTTLNNRSVSSSAPPPSYGGLRQQQQGQQTRSFSAGSYPTSLTASTAIDRRNTQPSSNPNQQQETSNRDSRIERSFVAQGYEEIRAEEFGDFPPVVESRRLSTGVGGGSWWRWGQGQAPAPGAEGTTSKKQA